MRCYICKDIDNEQDECRCKNEKQNFNQCCQECSDVTTCKAHCDYAHDYDCMAKKEIDD